jgi:uncharacterized protein (DUF433 family)
MTTRPIPLGIGIYSRAEAARLIGVSQSRLRRWVGGYRYWSRYWEEPQLRERPPVIDTDLPVIEDSVALSFYELMELRVVKGLIDQGISLQRVRQTAALCAREFQTQHPFASRRVYTDGTRVYAALSRDDVPDVIELSERRRLQVILGEVVQPFLKEIDFDETNLLAHRWWPMGRSVPVVLDPRIAFGSPVLQGTAIRTSVAARMAATVPREEVAEAYDVDLARIEAAVEFEEQLAAA